MSDTLKACPFCGGEAEPWEYEVYGTEDVTCANDDCSVGPDAMTVKAWNTRAPSPWESIAGDMAKELKRAARLTKKFVPDYDGSMFLRLKEWERLQSRYQTMKKDQVHDPSLEGRVSDV